MIFKDFTEIPQGDKGKLVQAAVAPRPIAWVTTQDASGVVNLAPFSYFSMLSPEHLHISILRKKGEMKDTARNLATTKEAVFHTVSRGQLEAMDLSSKPLAANESEIDLIGATLVESSKVTVPGMQDALMRIEAKVLEHNELQAIDQDKIIADVFTLQVVGVHIVPELLDPKTGYVATKQLHMVARMAGPEYAEVSLIEDFTRAF